MARDARQHLRTVVVRFDRLAAGQRIEQIALDETARAEQRGKHALVIVIRLECGHGVEECPADRVV